MKRLALLFLAVVLAVAGPAGGSTVALAAASESDLGGSLARMDVKSVTPNVVTPSAPGELTITGTLTNTSGRTLTDIEGRVQRGSPVSGENAATRAMRGTAPASRTSPHFAPTTPKLAPGQSTTFRLRTAIRGGPDSLQVDHPGVYPLLINLNGVPESGNRARIADGRMLLPITGLPHAPPAQPASSVRTTMIVPLVDKPRLVDEIPGRPAVFTDDQMATSMAPGGRLYGLLQGVEDGAPSGSPLGSGLCFAIDPDLLSTARAMTGDYVVRHPNGTQTPGTGSNAARLWLSKLKSVTRGRCVIPLPRSDADLVAMSRAGKPGLMHRALSGANEVQQVLGTQPRRDVVWPIDGVLDNRTLAALTQAGKRTFLLDPSGLRGNPDPAAPTRIARSGAHGTPPAALPIDPLLSTALDPQHGTSTDKSAAPSPRVSGGQTVQNALGALMVRANSGQRHGSTLIAPPRRWNLTGDEMRSMLRGMRRLTEQHYIQPTALPDGATTPPRNAHAGSTLTYPVRAGTDEIPREVLDGVSRLNGRLTDLTGSMEKDRALNIGRNQIAAPQRNMLLHATSSAWRGSPQAARSALRTADDGVLDLQSGVQISRSEVSITRAASNAPTPLNIRNSLPMTVWIRLDVHAAPGVQVKGVGPWPIPAQGSRQVYLDTNVHRPGNFAVDVQARTVTGVALGRPARMQLTSTEYGTMTIALTGAAAVLLVVLVGRRIYRRKRRDADPPDGPGSPDSGDPGPEGPDSDRAWNGNGDGAGSSTPAHDSGNGATTEQPVTRYPASGGSFPGGRTIDSAETGPVWPVEDEG